MWLQSPASCLSAVWMATFLYSNLVARAAAITTSDDSGSSATADRVIHNGGEQRMKQQDGVVNVNVPFFALDDLITGRGSDDFASVLSSTGLLAVTAPKKQKQQKPGKNHPNLLPKKKSPREQALGGLCACHEALQKEATASSSSFKIAGPQNANAMLQQGPLSDDPTTWRTTIATATAGTTPLPLWTNHHGHDDGENDSSNNNNVLMDLCGKDTYYAMERLRDQVSVVTQAFVLALDRLLSDLPQEYLLRHGYNGGYSTVASIQAAANHLEHFHIYHSKPSNKSSNDKINWTVAGNAEHASSSVTGSDETITTPQGSTKTLQWHTDAGLFLSFVPALNCDSTASNDEGGSNHGMIVDDSFVLPTGERAVFPPSTDEQDVVVIMLGAGAQHWLQTSPIHLQATKHAVQMEPGQIRAWYGMMSLIPEIAIVQEYPQERTFGDMKRHMSLAAQSRKQRVLYHGALGGEGRHEDDGDVMMGDVDYDDTAISIGCGLDRSGLMQEQEGTEDDGFLLSLYGDDEEENTWPRRRRLQHVQSPDACNNSTNFFCWMSCLDIPNAQDIEGYLTEGYSLYCMDPAIYASSGNQVSKAVEPCENGYVHNSNCMGKWAITAPNVPGYEFPNRNGHKNGTAGGDFDVEFCYGGTSMYMDGFHWTDTTCVIYLFPEWVLTSQAKLVGAGIGTVMFGGLLEMIIHFRRRAVMAMSSPSSSFSSVYSRLAVSAIFYGLQLTMGYMLMLVIMTYNGVLFFCTILGLVFGHVLFNSKDSYFGKALNGNTGNGASKQNTRNTGTTITTNPLGVRGTGLSSSRPCCHDGLGNTDVTVDSTNDTNRVEQQPSVDNDEEMVVDVDNNRLLPPQQPQSLQIPEGATPCCQNEL